MRRSPVLRRGGKCVCWLYRGIATGEQFGSRESGRGRLRGRRTDVVRGQRRGLLFAMSGCWKSVSSWLASVTGRVKRHTLREDCFPQQELSDASDRDDSSILHVLEMMIWF
jgi:hypothetical protein